MAKIGIYSDVHFSHSSSILPTYENDNAYTTRLNMCKDSMIWAYNEFKKRKVDAVVNCGDTFNSHTVSADEITAYVNTINEIYKPTDNAFSGLDMTLIGNHDRFNEMFNSLSVLNLTSYSTLVNRYTYFDIENYDCYCISFYETKDFYDVMMEMLEKYPRQHNHAILFMHGDINGSYLSSIKRIENHIATDFLTSYFDIIINGHIHCHELIYNKNDKRIYNVGSLTSHSFADSNNHVPACWIFDTETGLLEQINNPHAIVFKTYEIVDNKQIKLMTDEVQFNKNRVILKIKCSFDLKEDIENALNEISNIVKYKFVFSYNKEIENKKDAVTRISASVDIKDEFITFLSTCNDLKGNINDYVNIIN